MRSVLLPLLLLTSAIVSAQPVVTTASLTSATSLPMAGTYYHRNDAAVVLPPGSSGANVIWDFSALTTATTIPYDYRLCSAFTNCNNFPGTSVVLLEAHPSFTTMTYYICDNDRLAMKGIANSNPGGYAAVYTDPEDLLRFPFTFQDSYTDSFAASSSPPYGSQSGTIKVTADGYGTLILPQGNFYNVVRIKREERVLSAAGITQTLSYSWYDTALNEYLLNYKAVTVNGNSQPPSMSYTTQNPLGIPVPEFLSGSLTLVPNPVHGQLRIGFQLPVPAGLRISLTDVLGHPVRDLGLQTYGQGPQEVAVPTDGLSSGIYFVHLQGSGQSVARKIQVQ